MKRAAADSAVGAQALGPSYAQWRSSRLGRITDRLEETLMFELLEPLTGKTLLDVGCGDAAMAAACARKGAAVIGLDSDPAMIAAARRRAAKFGGEAFALVEGKAENLPFNDGSFDIVFAVTVLCFVRDPGPAIAEMNRVLKPGGRLVIGELGRWSLWAAHRRIRGWLGHPVWRAAVFRGPAALRRAAETAGLVVIAMRGAAYYPPCGIAAQLLAPLDAWAGRSTTFGAAFLAMSSVKPLCDEGRRPPARFGRPA